MKTHSQERAGRRRPLRWVALSALLSFAALAGASGLHVVVSIPPYQEIVTRLAGADATVEVLLPPGASPHTFDPTPRDLARLEGADLVVLNGGVDAFVHTLVDGADGHADVFVALDALAEADPDAAHDVGEGAHGEHDEDHGDHEHDHAGPNPHVWLDPVQMTRIVQALAEHMVEIAPARADATRSAADTLVDELEALDAELRELLAPVRGAAFVPFHDAWPHFAARYDLDLVLEIEPFPGREPGAGELARAVRAVREAGARAIFDEAQLAGRSAQVLAEEAGVAVATLDPLGDGGPYAELLRRNAETILAALTDE